MGETLSEWLIKHGWKQLDGSTLYSGEGEKFRKPKGYDAHGEIWIAPMSFGLLSIAPYIAGYFVDEENASHEYVFGPAAEQLAKAIEKFNKENEG